MGESEVSKVSWSDFQEGLKKKEPKQGKSFLQVQEDLYKLKSAPNEKKEQELILERAHLVNEAKEVGVFGTLKISMLEMQQEYPFDEAYKKIKEININRIENEAKGLHGWKNEFEGMLENYRDGALRNMRLESLKVEGKGNRKEAKELKRGIDLLNWGIPPVNFASSLRKKEQGSGGEKEQSSGFDANSASLLGKSIAEAMGSTDPHQQELAYLTAEEWGTAFTIKPGAEPGFLVLYEKDPKEWQRQKDIWELRSIFLLAASVKRGAGSVDSVANPMPEERGLDPLGIEFKKYRMEKLYKEVPGLIAAKSIYTTIIAGEDFLSGDKKSDIMDFLSGKKKDINYDLKKILLGDTPAYLNKLRDLGYNAAEIDKLKEERKELFNKCPPSIYVAKEESFYSIRESIRFFLKTKAARVMFFDGNDKERVFSSEEPLLVMERRVRDAEQIAWNFIFSTGLLESNNIPGRYVEPGIKEGGDNKRWTNEWIRAKGKELGPSDFQTLYLWMLFHPQQRLEAKVMNKRGTQKENWSYLGTWATNNIINKKWKSFSVDNVKDNGTIGEFTKVRVPTILRPDLVRDVITYSSSTKRAFFDAYISMGENILKNPNNYTHKGMYNLMTDREAWEDIGDSPFVSYRFDTLKWANFVFTTFKKGPKSKKFVDLAGLADAFRGLSLTREERENILMIRAGIDIKSPKLKFNESYLGGWRMMMNSMLKYQPDLFN